jgi:hypothetical protein
MARTPALLPVRVVKEAPVWLGTHPEVQRRLPRDAERLTETVARRRWLALVALRQAKI